MGLIVIIVIISGTVTVTIFEKNQCEKQDYKYDICEPVTPSSDHFVFAQHDTQDTITNTYNEKISDSQNIDITKEKEKVGEIKSLTKIQLLQNFILFLWGAIFVTIGITIAFVVHEEKPFKKITKNY